MKKSIYILIFITIICLWMSVTPVISNPDQSGTTLTAIVDAAPGWTITYGWTIQKSVTPAEWNLFKGDEGTSQFTIVVTKDNGTQEAWVEGDVCVTNGGAVATENLTIVAILQNGYGPPNDFLTSAPVNLSSHPILAPGETQCYHYRVNIPITGGEYPQPHASATYKVTANITITNHSGHLGEPFGPSPSATTEFLSKPTNIHDAVTVNDTNGYSWDFSASGSKSYEETYSCDSEAGLHENTATITYKDDGTTGPSSQASVMVKCYALEVKKDASPSFTRTYNWTIDKIADQNELTLSTGQAFTVNYSVKVDATFVDSNWAVAGKIWVKNPAPMAAVINSITDVVSTDIAAMVTCGVTFPYTLPAGETLECTYATSLPNADARTNTATATLQNHAYDYQLNATATGTTNFIGTAAVDFAKATITYLDECLTVSDSYAGELGTVCFADGVPKTYTYSRNIGPYSTCGEYTVDNTASFTTNDAGVTGSDSWTIKVHVPCGGGCTLTPGYWKTHSKYGPAPYDNNWANLMPLGEDSPFYVSGKTWYQVLWTPPAGGNAYYILAHAYIAAKLNFLNGASSTPAIDAAVIWAENFFNTYTPTSNLSKIVSTKAKNYAALLDQYNNGLIGPGHCDEEMTAALPKEEAPAETDFENLFMESTVSVPTEYALNQNHPNPFNPSTTISFDIPKSSMVHLTIYNVAGQKVATIVNENLNAGHYTYIWNITADLPSGTYLYKLVTEEFSSVKQMVLVK